MLALCSRRCEKRHGYEECSRDLHSDWSLITVSNRILAADLRSLGG
jgi:hypothetical protein